MHGQNSAYIDPFCIICVPYKIEYVNLKVFNMIKGIIEPKTSENGSHNKNGIMISVNVSEKKKSNKTSHI